MKKRIFAILCLLVIITLTFCSCAWTTEASKVNYNVTLEAENFNIYRRVTVINCIKGDVLFTVDGRMNIKADVADNQLELIVEVEKGVYKKHFIGLSDNVTYTVEDITGTETTPYKYEIHYNPNMWLPVTIVESD